MRITYLILAIAIFTASCNSSVQPKKNNQKVNSMAIDSTKQYGFNREFLKKFTRVIELRRSNSAIAIVPSWQGRVMTSTSEGDSGFSFGWINRDLIASGRLQPHINAFGGEERIWLGPEGGQFSIFFSKGKAFTFDNWQTPAFIDTTPWDLISSSDTSVTFAIDIATENYSGTAFVLRLEREITLMSAEEMIKQTGIDLSGADFVAYRSCNTITNKGDNAWKKETGLLSIWMLGMFNPSPSVVVVIPFKPGELTSFGPVVNDNYFGRIAGDRLKVSGNHVFFRADGKSRGKIGISPLRATGIMGSYDPENRILTLLTCRLPEGRKEYVNSSWQIQDNPFSGDVLNSYNDGPLADGSQMGPFYELETSSPAAALKPGESLSHVQYTIHLTGNPDDLNKISGKVLGAGLEDIKNAF